LIRLVAAFVAIAWVGVATMSAAIAAGALLPELRVRSAFLTGLSLLVVGGVAGLGLGALVRCTECAAPLFDQSVGARHESVRPLPLLNYWASSIIAVLRDAPLICGQCGVVFVYSAASASAADPSFSRSSNQGPDTVNIGQHRLAILAGHSMYVVGLFGALGLYQWGGFSRTDLRPLLIGLGFAWSAIMIAIALAALASGTNPTKAIAAYAIDQNMPLRVLQALTCVGIVMLLGTIVSLFR
jgi:hypothetical protein